MKRFVVAITENQIPLGSGLRNGFRQWLFVVVDDVTGVNEKVRIKVQHLCVGSMPFFSGVDCADGLASCHDEANRN